MDTQEENFSDLFSTLELIRTGNKVVEGEQSCNPLKDNQIVRGHTLSASREPSTSYYRMDQSKMDIEEGDIRYIPRNSQAVRGRTRSSSREPSTSSRLDQSKMDMRKGKIHYIPRNSQSVSGSFHSTSSEWFTSCNTSLKNLTGDVDGLRMSEKEKRVPPSYTKFGYKRLKLMTETNHSNDIILYISNNLDTFRNLLKEKPRFDILELLIQLLAKSINSEFRENKIEIYMILWNSDFIEYLNFQITSILTINKCVRAELCNFFKNLFILFEDFMNLLPSKAVETLKSLLSVAVVVLRELLKGSNMFSDVLKTGEKLQGDLDVIMERFEKSSSKPVKVQEKPPNDFRSLSIYPTADDFEKRNFLRENIVEGCYMNVYHYLDVQFRLIREDFIEPLRQGIKQFKESLVSVEQSKRRNLSVRFYRNVKILGFNCDRKQLGDFYYTVQLDYKFSSRCRWEYSKRLLYGSLLLFTKDNFESFQMATVSERDIGELRNGLFKVSLVGANIFGNELTTSDFIMAESSAFFEPTYQTLSTIQSLPLDKLPMQKYLLVQDIFPCPPSYLLNNGPFILKCDKIILDDDSSWPPCDKMGFNESQYDALKAALTNEFVVIQGPPGTGKTYLGLSIVKALLQNVNFKAPILLVCYTNHALDQFLEGLTEFTEDIIRIGGQSKNEALNRFNFKNKRGKYCLQHPRMDHLREKMVTCLAKIDFLSDLMGNVRNCVGILNLYKLHNFLELEAFSGFDNSLDFEFWILGEYAEFTLYLMDRYKSSDNTNQAPNVSSDQNGSHESYEEEEEEDSLIRRELSKSWVDEDIDNFDNNLEGPRTSMSMVSMFLSHILTINQLQMISHLIKSKKRQGPLNEAEQVENDILDYDLSLTQNILLHFQKRLNTAGQKPLNHVPNLLKCNKWSLSDDDRWELYHYWLRNIEISATQDIDSEQDRYSTMRCTWKELKIVDDYSNLKHFNPKILGLTTTGAARHHSLLSALKPAVIVVEEAAEVLEAHILVSLTQSCQHLILIGDHKQLRPNPSTMKLAKDFHLDISLFERMLRNGVGCNMLKVQHRMKPNIASLISPTIYPDLLNHESVLNYPSILGVQKNLFFIDHNVPEKHEVDMDSRNNPHEAEFMIALCRHLLLQGYEASDITILTTYASQQYLLRDLKKQNSLLKEVRMTVVDNYQGEECKIILLSLVRSNEEGKIGFLGIENRVCVALSRAKHGLFIIGNMTLLKENSEIWQKINVTLESQGAIGKSLSLVCQMHGGITEVKCAKDFERIVEGGCHLMCERLMPCGHKCKSLCHVIDPKHGHVQLKCLQPCSRVICNEVDHTCPLQCFKECLPCQVEMKRVLPKCGHEIHLACHIEPSSYKCLEMVKGVKPECGHEVEYLCFMDINNVDCQTPCDIRLNCGHACGKNCHVNKDPEHLEYKCLKECAKKNDSCQKDHKCIKRCWEECDLCIVQVTRTLPCGHTHKIACFQNSEEFECRRDCGKILPCGHKCKKLCFQACGDCKEMVKKTIAECGHTKNAECRLEVTRKMCWKACASTLACGHPCLLKCSQDCSMSKCNEYVPSPVVPACGHPSQVVCHLSNNYTDKDSDELLRYCQEPCSQELPCKDICEGTCGRCMQGRLHQVCQETCGNILICGHKCSVPCREDCPPCKKVCLYKCCHSRCGRNCGSPCVPCREKCPCRCEHSKCSKLCGELCDRPPCTEKCSKKLKCKHPCVGFCGEPCPKLCRTCDHDKLCELFFGTEDDEDARFVVLNDCKHVLESTGLEHWLHLEPEEDGAKEIGVKVCPKCKTPIITTTRFANEIKMAFTHVQAVKKRIFGQKEDINSLREDIKADIDLLTGYHYEKRKLWERNKNFELIMNNVLKIYHGGWRRGKSTPGWKFGIGQLRLCQFLCIYLNGLLKAISALPLVGGNNSTVNILYKKIEVRFDLLLYHLSRRTNKVSQREIDQFNLELKRFVRISEFYGIVHCLDSLKLSEKSVLDEFNKIMSDLFSIKQYDFDGVMVEAIDKFTESVGTRYNPVTQEELRMVHEAMRRDFRSASKQGHWFQCSNGHIYTITECGGAMQKGICPDCKEVIGGQNHSLVSSSRLASHVDGAKSAAWSDRQNLQNFHLD